MHIFLIPFVISSAICENRQKSGQITVLFILMLSIWKGEKKVRDCVYAYSSHSL
jgi:hypothetical protein